MKKHADPWLQEEKTKYAHPIASRKFILNHLEKLKGKATYQQLTKVLQIKTSDQKKNISERIRNVMRASASAIACDFVSPHL